MSDNKEKIKKIIKTKRKPSLVTRGQQLKEMVYNDELERFKEFLIENPTFISSFVPIGTTKISTTLVHFLAGRADIKYDFLEYLLTAYPKRVNVNKKLGSIGDTPLHRLAVMTHIDRFRNKEGGRKVFFDKITKAITLLIDHGADFTLKNTYKETCLDILERYFTKDEMNELNSILAERYPEKYLELMSLKEPPGINLYSLLTNRF